MRVFKLNAIRVEIVVNEWGTGDCPEPRLLRQDLLVTMDEPIHWIKKRYTYTVSIIEVEVLGE